MGRRIAPGQKAADAKERNAQPDRACRRSAPDQLERRLIHIAIRYGIASEEVQKHDAFAHRRRNGCPWFGPSGCPYPARGSPVTDPLESRPSVDALNSPRPLLAGVQSPRGSELVFHDPLSHTGGRLSNTGGGLHTGIRDAAVPLRGSSGPDRLAADRSKRRRPGTRADAIEAVRQDLRLLALRRGNPSLQRGLESEDKQE